MTALRSIRRLVLAALASLWGSFALAQGGPDFSTVEASAQSFTAGCQRWRVSESPMNSRARMPLGKASDAICRHVAEKWSGRLVEMYRTKDGSGPIRALAEICRDIAEKLAGRAVEVVWCSSWEQRRGGHVVPHPGPPDEVWKALDGSPFEGVAVKKSSRDELLREVIERRLGKDWDQIQVKTDMEVIGFVCGVWNRRGERDPIITNTTPEFACTGNVSEVVGAPSKPLFLFGLLIHVAVKFADPGGPPGWQEIQVKTGEAHL